MGPLGQDLDLLDQELLGPAPARPASRRPPRHIGQGDSEPAVLLRRYRRRAVTGDLLAATIACLAAVLVRFGPLEPALSAPFLTYFSLTLALPPAWVAVVALQGGYERRFLGSGAEEFRRLVTAGLVMLGSIAVLAYALRSEVARGFVFLAVPATVLLTMFARRRLRAWVRRLRARGLALQRVLVVGRADAVVPVIEKLDREPQHGLLPVGACVPFVGGELSRGHDVPVAGDPGRVLDAVRETGAHAVAVVSHPDLSGQALRRLSWALEDLGVQLIVAPGIVEVAGPRLSVRPVAGLSLLQLERPATGGSGLLGKAVFDRVAALSVTLLALPLLVLIALGVRLTSRGPVFYRQKRVGAEGREFTMLKFRSMVADADRRPAALLGRGESTEVLFKLRRDPRVTRFGAVLRRFSLDELPQLLNVLRGDMSLVGPRPPLPRQMPDEPAGAPRRASVRPGLTGLGPVTGRSDLSWEDSLRTDLRYTQNWSLALDVAILWRTLRTVVGGTGAS
ncbi:sugar transferase [Kineosporia rhizophila]|uniref:sugar transferase n=1 Tax=Kineosporia TaxID=49184 RepID=UPI001E3B684B|nr:MULTISPECIES: sugar transferase [Kineosporia]MCE0535086.1 sugar transferase [Kineosporia rhizophila]GLY14630.1 exopolysaccharide biosynthesis polyprenyl glycosylphosphotransferase [Kineosporia sp. NBRC 101677]